MYSPDWNFEVTQLVLFNSNTNTNEEPRSVECVTINGHQSAQVALS